MRFRRFNLLPCLAIFSMAALVSCSDDETDAIDFVPDSFAINGQKYNTLQDAVQAAAATGDEGTVIKLTSNTSGDGFTVNQGIINIDFGPYTYYLNSGKAITANSSYVAMTGTGGTLKGSGTVIKCDDSALDIEGNLNITGDINAKETVYCGFFEDYSGSFTGNVNLDDAYMYVEADKAVLNIGTLTTKEAALNVAAAKSVNINSVANDAKNQFPVRSDVSGVVTVKSGAEVHVHKYGAGEPFSCADPSVMVKSCTECDHFEIYMDENSTKLAACKVELLEHVAAVAPTATEWGNVEYWECHECGKYYADAQAKQVLDPSSIMVEPKTILDLDDFINPFEAQTRLAINPETIKKAVEGITKAVEIVTSITSFLNGDPDEETVMQEKIAEMDKKLDQILGDLKDIKGQINKLSDVVKAEIAGAQLNVRMSSLRDLETALSKFKLLDEAITNYGLDSDEVLEILDEWNTGNTQRYLTTQQLANDYAPEDAPASSNVNNMWEAVLKTQVQFEHEGYGPRMTSMIHDAYIIQYSAAMAALYIGIAKPSSETILANDLRNLQESLDRYQKGLQAAYDNMSDRSGKYIVFYDSNEKTVTFNKVLSDIDVRKTIADNQQRCIFKYDVHVTGGCNTYTISQMAGLAPAFDQTFVLKVLRHYSPNTGSGITPAQALQKCGFKGTDKPIAMYMEDKHERRDGYVGCCGNFYWRAYVMSSSKDWLKFRGILNNRTDVDHASGNNLWGEQYLWDEGQIELSSSSGAVKNINAKNEDRGKYVTATVAQ